MGLISVPVRWVDIDAYGHVNNSRYFDFMTEARAVFLKQFMHLAKNLHFILVDTHCNFKRPIYYPSVVHIQQNVQQIGTSSFELRYVFYVNDDHNTIMAEGSAKMVCFDPIKKAASPLPVALNDFLHTIRE